MAQGLWWLYDIYQHLVRSLSTFQLNSHTNDGQGLHINLRRLPKLLQDHSPQRLFALCHLLDRHRASLAPHRRGRAIRPAVRSRVLPLHASRRQLLSGLWHYDVELKYDVLAGVFESRVVHGLRSGIAVYPEFGTGWRVVLEEESAGYGDRYEWNCCRYDCPSFIPSHCFVKEIPYAPATYRSSTTSSTLEIIMR